MDFMVVVLESETNPCSLCPVLPIKKYNIYGMDFVDILS